MLLSKACVYGIRGSLYLATLNRDDFVPIRELSEKLDISFHFLTKILQQLSAEKIIESYKGPAGGVKLTRPGNEISLLEIVLAVDGPDLLTECALGLPGCGHMKPCPLHDHWAETRESIRAMLEKTSISELAKKGKELDLRITADGGFNFE